MRWGLILLALLLLICIPFVLFEAQIESLMRRAIDAAPGSGHLAVLIGGALALDVILPVPSSVLNAVAGAALGFLLASLVCWAGLTLGCLFGYWIGATGGTALIRRVLGDGELDRATALAARIGGPGLVVMRAVPVLAEASTIAAGAARYPLARFVAVTGVANIGLAVVYAGIGAYSWSANSFLLAVAGAIFIPVLAYGVLAATTHWTGIALSAANERAPTRSIVSSQVETSDFAVPYTFPVVFTRGLFDPGNTALARVFARENGERARCLVVIDDGVVAAYPELARDIEAYCASHAQVLQLIDVPAVLPGGEQIKGGLEHVPEVYRLFLRNGIDRHAYVVAVGGGALLDAVGFAAATAHRGIRHIRVPTTVLAQNDSGVGVKNAINFEGIKNYVGTFAPPFAVLNDFDFLKHLPKRDRIAGVAEAIKVALIRDRAFFDWLEAHADGLTQFDAETEEYMIRHCAALHIRQIARGGDPFETGSARPLDFGHWSAHKLEVLTSHAVRHGEAVAIGIALDARYSVLAGLLAKGQDDRVVSLLDRLGLPTWHPVLEQTDAEGRLHVLQGLREFQEHLGGALTITLLRDIGVGTEVHQMDEARITQAIDWLKARRSDA